MQNITIQNNTNLGNVGNHLKNNDASATMNAAAWSPMLPRLAGHGTSAPAFHLYSGVYIE
jgi:hypothetical protein